MSSQTPSFGLNVTRRRLLVSAAAGIATSVLPLAARAEAARSRYDIIVVGGGSAGMTLAIFAAMRKAKVLVIEASPMVGGSLPLSGGSMAAAGTVFQKAQGIVDSPDRHYADTMRISKGTANPDITRLFVDNAGDTLNWLASKGYAVREGYPTAETGHEDFSVARYHRSENAALDVLTAMSPLFEGFVKSGQITVQMETSAVDLLQDVSGAVLGVATAKDGGGYGEEFGKNIVLTCGGCAGNPRMFQDLHNVPLYSESGYSFNQGMGITLGVAAGGYVWGRDNYIPQFQAVLSGIETPSPIDVYLATGAKKRPPWEIYVNFEGNRVVKEDEEQNWIREWALKQQTGHRLWVVFDQEAMDKAPPLVTAWAVDKYKAAFNTHPMFSKGQSIRELSVRCGINPINLAQTIATYNQAISAKTPDPFGREYRPVAIAKPPFYAVRMQGWSPVSLAGLAIDSRLRVIKVDGAPVANLYAAGEVIGGGVMAGNRFVGGSILTPALTFGRLLGEKMLKI